MTDVYYRVYRSHDTNEPTIVCMQWFDEHDYEEDRFLTPIKFDTERDANLWMIENIKDKDIWEETERLIRIGQWAEANRNGIICALTAVRWGVDDIKFLDQEEQKEIKNNTRIALDTSIWGKE